MNKLNVKIDRTLDIEFPTRKFAMILDLTSDNTTGKPALAFFNFKNTSMIHNTIQGVSMTSGPVVSPVAALKHVFWGTGSSVVFNPYKTVIMLGEESRDSWF